MNILFICNQNQNRSKTAAEMLKDRFNTQSAGLFNKVPVTKEQIKWSDKIVVMENKQRSEIVKRFPDIVEKKEILCFDIPDVYHIDQPGLVTLLKAKIESIL